MSVSPLTHIRRLGILFDAVLKSKCLKEYLKHSVINVNKFHNTGLLFSNTLKIENNNKDILFMFNLFTKWKFTIAQITKILKFSKFKIIP